MAALAQPGSGRTPGVDICVLQAGVIFAAWQLFSVASVPAKQTDNACLADFSQSASRLPLGGRLSRKVFTPPGSAGKALLLTVPAAQAWS